MSETLQYRDTVTYNRRLIGNCLWSVWKHHS